MKLFKVKISPKKVVMTFLCSNCFVLIAFVGFFDSCYSFWVWYACIKRFYIKSDKYWLFWDVVVVNFVDKVVSVFYVWWYFFHYWLNVIVDIFRNFGRVAVDRADYGPTWIVFFVYFWWNTKFGGLWVWSY